jgi:DNA-binding response OmpR family regulator
MAKLLVLEDDQDLQALIQAQLESTGHDVTVAGSAREALEKVRESPPDLALLDLNLPDMNGFEVLRALRANAATQRTPCIIMTALADPGGLLETAAGGLGAVDFIQKPFSQEDLKETVADALETAAPPELPTGNKEKGNVRLDARFRRVWVRGRAVGILPRRRFHLLWLLASREGPIPRQELLQSIWQDAEDPNRLEKTIQRLREDLGRDGPRLIQTLPGGYELKTAN